MRRQSRVSLQELLYVFFRHGNRVVFVLALALAGTAAWLALQPSYYTADTRLLVRVGKEKLAGVETLAKESHNILFQERGQDIHNAIEILKEKSLAYAVYDRLAPMLQPPQAPQGGLDGLMHRLGQARASAMHAIRQPLYWSGLLSELPPREQAVMALRNALRVEAIEDSDVILVAFSWSDPHFAALAVNTYAQEFLSKYVRVHENAQSQKFYLEQIKVHEDKLAEAEAALSTYRARHGITNLPLHKDMLLKEALEVEARLSDTTMRLEEYRGMRGAAASALAAGGWVETPEERQRPIADLSGLDKQWFELVARRSHLAEIMGDAHPEMQQLGPRMAQLRESKGRAVASVLTQKINLIARERDILEARVRDKRARLAALDQLTAELAELERARGVAEANFIAYKKKGEELRVSDLLSDEKFTGLRVVSEAAPPVEPAGPQRGRILGLAALLGLFFGIGFSAIVEYFNRRLRDEKDVEEVLGLPVLMTLPRLPAMAA